MRFLAIFKLFNSQFCIFDINLIQMTTIALHISEHTSTKEIEKIIKKSDIKRGDTIKIYKGDLDIESLILTGVFMVLAISLILSKKKTKSIEKFFEGYKSIKEIEKIIESEAGVHIDIEPKPMASSDPIDEVFGIWKNRENFDKDKFRDNAWRKIS